jgi:hypothetical protein
MSEVETIHVAIAPPAVLEEHLVEQVAAIVGRDIADTRLLLAGDIPRVIAHCQSADAAESTAGRLRELGLAAVVCRHSQLYDPARPFRAHAIEFGEGEASFRDKAGQERRMAAENAFLLLAGKTRNLGEEEGPKTRRKLNLPATILTGGIPIWSSVKEYATGSAAQAACFARVYDRESWRTGIEIPQDGVDYSCLGAERAFSTLANFNRLMTKLRAAFPRAVFDERLARHPEAVSPSARWPDSVEIKCRLIHLFCTAGTGPDL